MGGTATADELTETFTRPQVIRGCHIVYAAGRHQGQAEVDLSIAGAAEWSGYQQVLGQAGHCRADVLRHVIGKGTLIVEFVASSCSDGSAGGGSAAINRTVIHACGTC